MIYKYLKFCEQKISIFLLWLFLCISKSILIFILIHSLFKYPMPAIVKNWWIELIKTAKMTIKYASISIKVHKLRNQMNFEFLRNDAFRFAAAACFVVFYLLDCRTCLGVFLLCDIAQKIVENLVDILARFRRGLDVLYFPLPGACFCFF